MDPKSINRGADLMDLKSIDQGVLLSMTIYER